MILSVSRRTDVPRFYMDWFASRLEAGFVQVRNPMNPAQVSEISLSRDVVDCIVFWTKDAAPLLKRMDALAGYDWLVQFTLNAYGPDLEADLPGLETRLDTFRELSAAVGPKRVVWRYSPVVLNAQHSAEWHLEIFARLAQRLQGSTVQCKMSFLDMYDKIKDSMAALGAGQTPPAQKVSLARQMEAIAAKCGISLSACGDAALVSAGIAPANCVDKRLIEEITGGRLALSKDKGQRAECSCVSSIDIGAYDTCPAGCRYCYANRSQDLAKRRFAQHDAAAPMLFGALGPHDRLHRRAVKSDLERQLALF